MMKRLAAPLLITVMAMAAAPALAQQKPQPRPVRAEATQPVFICATDASTRRSFQREHGVQPTFVTAREALSARSAGETWTTPRCMTEREVGRLNELTGLHASS